MTTLTQRTTIYFDPELLKALKFKATEVTSTVSELVNSAIKNTLQEDAQDIAAFKQRQHEPSISFEQVLADLKAHGKI
ncbi:hypothetical protein BH10PSE19_BH10PSE19_21470 [soil metagenome]